MDDFEKELKASFLEEASQLLADTEQCFLTLEHSPTDAATIDKIFRLAHNLKGSSKAVGFDEMGAFAHEFESLLLKIKNSEIATTPEVISLLLRCNDHLGRMVEACKADADAKTDCTELFAEIHAAMSGQLASAPAVEPVEDFSPEIDVSEIQALQHFEESHNKAAEEIPAISADMHEEKADVIPLKPAAPAHNNGGSANNAKAAQTDESIRVSLARLEKLLNFVGEMVILQTVLREQTSTSNPTLRRSVHQMSKVTKEIQDISMSLRMVPLKQTFQKMQRIVRDTSSTLKKKINFHIVGEETEVDKTVLENINDPLVHLIRNACDHGIESPEKRLAAGKSEFGEVYLSAYHQSGKLVIEIKDDGGGINPEILHKKATEKGILKPGQEISDRDAIHLIFHPGFSTKEQVTDVSGRGVGMDVVKTNIEAMQGEILVDTVLGKGSTFKVVLPLTLAIIDGMIVTTNSERFVIPLSHVHESVRPQTQDLKWVTGLGEVMLLRGENLPLYRMEHLLNKKSTSREATDCIALVIRVDQKPFAVLVDDILGQHQVVIKKLGDELTGVKGFSGSTVLGDGRPSLILELGELIGKGTKQVATPPTTNNKQDTNNTRRAVA